MIINLSKFTVLLLLVSVGASAQKVTCPSGQHWDTSMGMCMPDATPAPACPEGQYWDPAMKMCMPIPPPETFRGVSRSIFSTTCVSCHHANQPNEPSEAGIDLSSYAGLMAANQNAANPRHSPFIIAGDPEHSKMYIALKAGKMPKNEDDTPGTKLSDELIQNIYDWIKAGALNN